MVEAGPTHPSCEGYLTTWMTGAQPWQQYLEKEICDFFALACRLTSKDGLATPAVSVMIRSHGFHKVTISLKCVDGMQSASSVQSRELTT